MFLRVWRLITLVLAALCLTMTSAHVLELPAKMRYDAEMYAAVNRTLYQLFATVGAFYTIGAIVAAAILTYLVRDRPSFQLTLGGTLCLGLAFGMWLVLVQPVNAEWLRVIQTAPEAIPDAYLRLRPRWEYSHAAGFVVTLAGVVLLVLSVVIETPTDRLRKREV
jgi:hypothetical protein